MILSASFWGLAKYVVFKMDENYTKHEERIRYYQGGRLRPPTDDWGREESHPYFGYRMTEDWPDFEEAGLNNYHFESKIRFPYKKKNNEVVIGVFGGSVAFFFARQHGGQSEWFNPQFRKHIKGFEDKEITLLNFAMPAAHQPQQFFIFSHFFQTVDIAIFLDGWNEIHNGRFKDLNFPLPYPRFSQFLYSPTTQVSKDIGDLELLKSQLRFIQKKIKTDSVLLPVGLWMRFKRTWLQKQIQSKQRLLSQVSQPSLDNGLRRKKKSGRQMAIDGFNNWLTYTHRQEQICKSYSKKCFFFFQPHVLYKKKRVGKEKLFDSGFEVEKELVKHIYPYAEKILARPENNYINNFAGIFEQYDEEAFVDNVHVYGNANRIFALKMLPLIAKEFEATK